MKKKTTAGGGKAAGGGRKKTAAAPVKKKRAAPARPAGKATTGRALPAKTPARRVTAQERERKAEATKQTLRARVRAAGATTLAATGAGPAVATPPPGPVKGGPLPDTRAAKLAQRMYTVLDDMQAINPVILPVGERTPMADYFIVASGKSTTHTRALFNALYRAMKEEHTQLRHSEGQNAAVWILADYGSVVAHLFEQENRGRYALEELWQATNQLRDEDLL